MKIDRPEVLVFDFDGVVVGHSEFFKEEAWHQVFAPYRGLYELPLTKTRELFGFGKKGDRFDVLRYVYEQVGVAEEDIPALVERGARQFNDLVQAGILRAGVVPGGKEVLGRLAQRLPLYVNSGTSTVALQQSVESLELGQVFRGVYGGPASKVENLMMIAEVEGKSPSQLLMIGDSDGDWQAAKDFGCHFIGVANDWNKWENKSFPLIIHLADLLPQLL